MGIVSESTIMNPFIGALSGWKDKYRQRRERCRELWASRAFMVFILNTPCADNIELMGDCLHIPGDDDYKYLTPRVLKFFRWALAQGVAIDGLWKMDDDTDVDLDRLRTYDTAGADYIGAEWLPGYGKERFGVTYASGGAGYFLSHRAVEVVAAYDGILPTIYEDVNVGWILQEHGIYLRVDQESFVPKGRFAGEHPGVGNNYATIHQALGVWP
jgi:hypothetical protein